MTTLILGHSIYFAIASRAFVYWPLIALVPAPPRWLVRSVAAGYATTFLVGTLLANAGIVPSPNDVLVGPIAWHQFHPGVIPSLACIYLMLAIPHQGGYERVLTTAAVLASGSLTGTVLIWPVLFGRRGVTWSLLALNASFFLGGDLPAKLSDRLMLELGRALDYPNVVAMSLCAGSIALWRKDAVLGMLALSTLRMGGGLWLDPIVVLMAGGGVSRGLALSRIAHSPQRPRNCRSSTTPDSGAKTKSRRSSLQQRKATGRAV